MAHTCTVPLTKWIAKADALEKRRLSLTSSSKPCLYLHAVVRISAMLIENIIHATASINHAGKRVIAPKDRGADLGGKANPDHGAIHVQRELAHLLKFPTNLTPDDILAIENIVVTVAEEENTLDCQSNPAFNANSFNRQRNGKDKPKIGVDPCMGFFAQFDEASYASATQKVVEAHVTKKQKVDEEKQRRKKAKQEFLKEKQKYDDKYYGMGLFSQISWDQLVVPTIEGECKESYSDQHRKQNNASKNNIDVAGAKKNEYAQKSSKNEVDKVRYDIIIGAGLSDPNLRQKLASLRESQGEKACLVALGKLLFTIAARGQKLPGRPDGSPFNNFSRPEFLLLRKLGLPQSICRFISDLINPQITGEDMSNDAFLSLYDAHCDINQMIQNPDVFLHDFPTEYPSPLPFGSKLYGREAEINAMREASKRVAPPLRYGRNEAIFVSGHSGMGKSQLIQAFELELKNEASPPRWYFLRCKFDRMEQTKPLSVIASVFNAFFESLSESPEHHENFIKLISCELSIECLTVLSGMIPGLANFSHQNNIKLKSDFFQAMNQSMSTSMLNADNAKNRMFNLFRVFFQCVLRVGPSVVLVVDDLQWADSMTLELIQDLVAGNTHEFRRERKQHGIPKILFIGCYRDNEVGKSHPLSDFISRLERSPKSVSTMTFNLALLSSHMINQMISELLRLPCRITKPLAQLVSRKTLGNPYFVIEFMKSLIDAKHLCFDFTDRRWKWDDTVVDLVRVKEGVADFMIRKLRLLSDQEQESLKILSCFGGQISISALKYLDNAVKAPGLINCIRSAVELGFVDKTEQLFMFAHDMVQEAAYCLIPENDRPSIHFQLGTTIYDKALSDGNVKSIALVAANQINRGGVAHIRFCKIERVKFAKLNNLAGEISLSEQSFQSAAYYFQSGLALLDESHWKSEYGLTLRLHQASALTLFITGKLVEVTNILQKILNHAMSIDDEMSSLVLWLKYFIFSGDMCGAVKKGLAALRRVGEVFPDNPSPADAERALLETKNRYKSFSEQRILSFPKMTDIRKEYAMKIIVAMVPCSYSQSPYLFSMLVCRMIDIVLQEEAICDEFPFAVALFGLSHVVSNDIVEGYQLGKFALNILRRSPANPQSCKVYMIVGILGSWTEPPGENHDNFATGIEQSWLSGDIEYVILSSAHQLQSSLYYGKNLKRVYQISSSYCRLLVRYQNCAFLEYAVSKHSAVSRLLGVQEETYGVFSGSIKSEEDMLISRLAENDFYSAANMHLKQLFVAFIFRDMNVAAQNCDVAFIFKIPEVTKLFYTFYQALTAFNLARETKEKKWITLGKNSIEKMAGWAKASPKVFDNKLFLMYAESHFTNGRHLEAMAAYQSAIDASLAQGFVHEGAISCELASAFLSRTGEIQKSFKYLRQAKDLYIEWGASAKAKTLICCHKK